jgi:hypothetical protein
LPDITIKPPTLISKIELNPPIKVTVPVGQQPTIISEVKPASIFFPIQHNKPKIQTLEEKMKTDDICNKNKILYGVSYDEKK